MMTFILVIHCIVCLALIILVLVQRGRGGGLVESFSGVESMFGTHTSTFLTKATTICAVFFFVACVSLAVLSAHRSRSLMRNVVPTADEVKKAAESAAATAEETTQEAAAATQKAAATAGEKAGEQTPAE